MKTYERNLLSTMATALNRNWSLTMFIFDRKKTFPANIYLFKVKSLEKVVKYMQS